MVNNQNTIITNLLKQLHEISKVYSFFNWFVYFQCTFQLSFFLKRSIRICFQIKSFIFRRENMLFSFVPVGAVYPVRHTYLFNFFLGATKHLYNWLCLLVSWLVGWSVTHSFVAPYWPTWPCFLIKFHSCSISFPGGRFC